MQMRKIFNWVLKSFSSRFILSQLRQEIWKLNIFLCKSNEICILFIFNPLLSHFSLSCQRSLLWFKLLIFLWHLLQHGSFQSFELQLLHCMNDNMLLILSLNGLNNELISSSYSTLRPFLLNLCCWNPSWSISNWFLNWLDQNI